MSYAEEQVDRYIENCDRLASLSAQQESIQSMIDSRLKAILNENLEHDDEETLRRELSELNQELQIVEQQMFTF